MTGSRRNLIAGATRPAGFTLLEVILVLAIVGVIMALAVPAVGRMQQDRALRQAASDVRIELLRTRVRALERGLPFQFRFTPGGTAYQVGPREHLASPDAGSNASAAAGTTAGLETFELPAGVTFYTPSSTTAGTSQAGQVAIHFGVNGSAQDGTLELVDTRGKTISLTLRGLTGTVAVSGVRSPSP